MPDHMNWLSNIAMKGLLLTALQIVIQNSLQNVKRKFPLVPRVNIIQTVSTSYKLIFTVKLLKQYYCRKLKPEKQIQASTELKPSWALLPTELQSHMLGARQILI